MALFVTAEPTICANLGFYVIARVWSSRALFARR
jgi:hypothetical protein